MRLLTHSLFRESNDMELQEDELTGGLQAQFCARPCRLSRRSGIL